MTEKKRDDLLGGAMMLVALTLLAFWATTQIDNNITQIKGIASNYINEQCGTELGIDDVKFESEGTNVWYVTAPVSVLCMEPYGEENKRITMFLWSIPRSGSTDSG